MSESMNPAGEAAIAATLERIAFDGAGLVPAIAQQHDSGEVLMLAWMNREAIAETLRTRPGVLLVALAGAAVAQGRDLGPGSKAGGFPGRL